MVYLLFALGFVVFNFRAIFAAFFSDIDLIFVFVFVFGARYAGSSDPPWTDRDHVATGAPKATTERGDPWSTQTTNSIRIEPSERRTSIDSEISAIVSTLTLAS